ncbi:MAG: YbhN family protein [Lachnospiraceae bacterium]|nr:YbhN family protein [Lachnospiraceae bacterium]
MSYKMDKKKVISSLIKWILILGLMTFACIKYKSFFIKAVNEIYNVPVGKIAICALLANIYFVAEGSIISLMTSKDEHKLTLFQGVSCAYMCAFYRVTTLGSGTGVSQLYYYNTKKIDVSSGTGMSMAQYTFMKITVGVIGVVSFILLLLSGNRLLTKYWTYMLAGSIVISLICLFLFIITVSKTISGWLIKLGYKLVRQDSKLYPRLVQGESAVKNLQNCGRMLWQDKRLFFKVVFLNIFKFMCWYSIPGIILREQYDIGVFTCLALMAVCNMVGCVMLAPSGVGTLEFVVTIFFGTIIPEGHVIAATLVLYRFFTWIVPFIIGIVPALFLKKAE